MLLTAVSEDPLDVIIAVEDDAALEAATATQGGLRRSHFSTDMIATGSPKKRFDKATKVNARVILSLAMQDGKVRHGLRGEKAMVERIGEHLQDSVLVAK